MRHGEAGWVVFLTGLPFASFLNRSLDLWHAQAYWAQAWVVGLFLYTVAKGWTVPPSRAVAAYAGWTFGTVLWGWYHTLRPGHPYPLPLILGPLNVLFVVLFILSAQWTAQTIDTLLTWLGRMGLVLGVYGLLQWANLDQFFQNLDRTSADVIVGTIGNPSLFAVQLAMLLPIYLFRRHWVGVVLTCVVLGALAVVRHSVGGPLTAAVVLLWWVWWAHRTWLLPTLLLLAGLGVWLTLTAQGVWNPEGRLAAWSVFWDIFAKKPITGFGLGFLRELSSQVTQGPIYQWRHVHNEYLQVGIEQGVIGVALLGWVLAEVVRGFARMVKTPAVLTLAGMGLAFLISSTILFPAHLWVTGSLGLVSYCGLRSLHGAQES